MAWAQRHIAAADPASHPAAASPHLSPPCHPRLHPQTSCASCWAGWTSWGAWRTRRSTSWACSRVRRRRQRQAGRTCSCRGTALPLLQRHPDAACRSGACPAAHSLPPGKPPVLSVNPHVPALLAYAQLAAQQVSGAPVIAESGELIANLSVSDIRWAAGGAAGRRGGRPPRAGQQVLGSRCWAAPAAGRPRGPRLRPPALPCSAITAEQFGALALPVAEFLAVEHGTAYLGYSATTSQHARRAPARRCWPRCRPGCLRRGAARPTLCCLAHRANCPFRSSRRHPFFASANRSGGPSKGDIQAGCRGREWPGLLLACCAACPPVRRRTVPIAPAAPTLPPPFLPSLAPRSCSRSPRTRRCATCSRRCASCGVARCGRQARCPVCLLPPAVSCAPAVLSLTPRAPCTLLAPLRAQLVEEHIHRVVGAGREGCGGPGCLRGCSGAAPASVACYSSRCPACLRLPPAPPACPAVRGGRPGGAARAGRDHAH